MIALTQESQLFFFAGQIVDIEAYIGNIASDLVAGMNLVRLINREELASF